MATYYVKNTGSDDADGLSDGNAWEFSPAMPSASGVSNGTTLGPGDFVLFNKGDTWQEPLLVPASGSVGNPLTYGAYGTGDKPIITQFGDLQNDSQVRWDSVSWSDQGGNIWTMVTDAQDGPGRLWIDGTEKVPAANATVTAQAPWFFNTTGDILYVYSTESPATAFSSMEVSAISEQYTIKMANRSHITLDGIDVQGGMYCIYPVFTIAATFSGHKIVNCTFGKYCSGRALYVNSFNVATVIEDGIVQDNIIDMDCDITHVWTYNCIQDALGMYGIKDWDISNNTIRNWTHNAVDIGRGFSSAASTGNKVHHNTIEQVNGNLNYGRAFSTWGEEGLCQYNEFYKNRITDTIIRSQIAGNNNLYYNNIVDTVKGTAIEANNGQAFVFELLGGVCHDNQLINNSLYFADDEGVGIANSAIIEDNIITNNIISACGASNDNYGIVIRSLSGNNVWNNNDIYSLGVSDLVDYKGTPNTVAEFNGQSSDTTANNINVDPQFVDADNHNFHLLLASECVDAGVNVGLSTDYDDVVIEDPPEIGVYEAAVETTGLHRIGLPKNIFYLMDPGLLDLPIFRGLLYLQPFINLGGNSVMDLVRGNGLQTRNNTDVSWGYNEYGPTMVNNAGWVVTNVPSNKITMDNFTLLSWASTVSSGNNRELLGGFYDNENLYIRFGRFNNQPLIITKTSGYAISTGVAADHNDGLLHMFSATSSPNALKLYYEGKEIASESAIDGAAGSTEEFWIGNTDEDYGWLGEISLAVAWDRPLSAAEMDLMYRMGPGLILNAGDFPITYNGAIAAGVLGFNVAWAYNTNQVL